jgi:hypothetical protein
MLANNEPLPEEERETVMWGVNILLGLAGDHKLECRETHLAMSVPALSKVGTADALCVDLYDHEAASPALDKMVQMREELSQIWLNTSHSREQLAADLQAWCRRAEESGIAALRDFSVKLRAVRQTA